MVMESIVKLPQSFFLGENVCEIAEKLLGKVIVTRINEQITPGIIIETEAYAGPIDRASHAYNNKRTKRTETMFGEGGVAYIYLIYGIHHLFNVVTNSKDIPHAVLVRGIEPLEGLEIMQQRRNTDKLNGFTYGPGTATQALGIKTLHDGENLRNNTIWIEERGIIVKPGFVIASRRIGVDYAGDHADWLWNFRVKPETLIC